MIDGEWEDVVGVEEVEGVGFGVEFEMVVFEGDGVVGGDGFFEGEEEIFGFVDLDEFNLLVEEGVEFVGVV